MPKASQNIAAQEVGASLLVAAATACPHGLMLEEAGRVVYANPAYARLVGAHTPTQVVGKLVRELPPPGSGPVAPPRRTKKPNQHDARPSPEYDTARARFRLGHRWLSISVVRDVSEHHRMEKQLRDAQKMEALGRLVGGVAHDFNNLLTAITLYSDLLLENVSDLNARRQSREIHTAAQRGATLVRQLLAFARQQPLAPQTVSINHVLADMSELLERLIGEDIELELKFHEGLAPVCADPGQLQQAVLNLVMNARDAMREGGRLTIETHNRHLTRTAAARLGLRAGSYAVLSVTDTGCGMDEHIRARLFEPFFTTKRTGEGTGLGLAMVYGYVTQSGGAVSVSSRPGHGTQVTVLLPRCGSACKPLHIQPDTFVAIGDTSPRLNSGRETILLVEDDAVVRRSVSQLLSASGYRVLEAADGTEALAIAGVNEIDLLLSDVVLPGRCGCDVARALRDISSDIRVLFISGYPASAKSAAAEAELLYKPFTHQALLAKVREVLCAPAASLAL